MKRRGLDEDFVAALAEENPDNSFSPGVLRVAGLQLLFVLPALGGLAAGKLGGDLSSVGAIVGAIILGTVAAIAHEARHEKLVDTLDVALSEARGGSGSRNDRGDG